MAEHFVEITSHYTASWAHQMCRILREHGLLTGVWKRDEFNYVTWIDPRHPDETALARRLTRGTHTCPMCRV